MRKVTILAGAFAATTALSTPVQALGPTCIPVLPNCMCTFMVPCPVLDAQGLTQLQQEIQIAKDKLQMLQSLRDPQAAIMQALRGQGPLTIPGLDSIGVDIGGLINGDLTSLGLPGSAGSFAQQLSDLGIDGNMLVSISKGELQVSDFISVATNAGLDLSALEQAGLGVDVITALAEGNLDASSVFQLASKLDLQGGYLNAIGISEDLIYSVAKGEIDPSRILDIAQNAGLEIEQLSSIGLDPATIMSLKDGGVGAVASILQKAGYGSQMISDLGLDAGMIAKISTGELPASAINELVAGTGIDPKSIVLPGVNGPISLGNLPGVSGQDLARATGSDDIITIPAGAVPGLGGALEAASGTDAAPGLFSGADNPSAAMCEGDLSLISVGEEPNGYGSDVEAINMALSGGTIETFAEVQEEAESVAAATQAFGLARSIQVRPILLKATEAVDTFDAMVQEAMTLEDDFIVNDTIRAQLMTLRAEKTSLMTSLLSVRASQNLVSETPLSPLPIFPNEGRFRDIVKQLDRETALQPARKAKIEAANYAMASQEYSKLQNSSREAILNYNIMQDARAIEAGMPSITEIIEVHDTYKDILYGLETRIRGALGVLYGGAADSAWNLLYPTLRGMAGSYANGHRYDISYPQAISLSETLTAQTAYTAYGPRVLLIPEREETPAVYTSVSHSPSHYGDADDFADRLDDPYQIRSVPAYLPGDDEGQNVGLELANLLQYYLETYRREAWNGEMRRGDAERSMTSAFWSEMIYHAPQCLAAPIPTTAEALAARPELFDLSPYCDHLEWSYGDPGDYIDASELGGADAVLWLSKINVEKARRRTGGEAAVAAQLEATLHDISSSSATSLLSMQGYDDAGIHVDAITLQLENALSDPTFSVTVEYPSRQSGS